MNLARTLGGEFLKWFSILFLIPWILLGFSVAYFQVPWALKNGAIQTFGCEAAYASSFSNCRDYGCLLTDSIVIGLFILVVPPIQLTGRKLRVSYSVERFKGANFSLALLKARYSLHWFPRSSMLLMLMTIFLIPSVIWNLESISLSRFWVSFRDK
jgi:hypothetical protein